MSGFSSILAFVNQNTVALEDGHSSEIYMQQQNFDKLPDFFTSASIISTYIDEEEKSAQRITVLQRRLRKCTSLIINWTKTINPSTI